MTTTCDFGNLTEKEIAVLLDTVLEVINNPNTPASTLETIVETALAKNIVEPIKSKILHAVDAVMQKRNSVEIISFDFGDNKERMLEAAKNKNTPVDILAFISKKTGKADILIAIAKNQNTSPETLDFLARNSCNKLILRTISLNCNTLISTLDFIKQNKISWNAKILREAEIIKAEIIREAKALSDAKNQKNNFLDAEKITKSIQQQSTGFKIPPPPEPLQFNTQRISEIKTESKKVSAMLNEIYEQDNLPTEALKINNSSVLNLDEAHLEIVKILATRQEWKRDELPTIMKGMMIDGVLEHINDAFFDYCDEAFIEGDDPIEITIKLYKEIFK